MPFPAMQAALWGLGTKTQFRRMVKTVVDFEVIETVDTSYGFGGYGDDKYDTPPFVGVLVPLPESRLFIKPEGQRGWKWWTLLTRSTLAKDDVVIDKQGKRFRVMVDQDWSGGGFYEYQLTEGFDDAGGPG